MRTPLVIAHRGDSSNALENSLEAVSRALLLPADMIELDVRMSRDKGLYVLHDKTTGRTAEENINVEQATTEELNRIKLKNGELLPGLPDVLKLVAGRCGLNLEIKSDGAGAMTAQYLLSSGYQGTLLLSSFKEQEVLAANGIYPGLPTSVIFDAFTPRDVPKYKAKDYAVISLRKKTVNKDLVDACHDHGIRLYVWTVDDEEEMKRLISWGVDGIYTNRPGSLREVINKLQIANYK
jgi:glycerophosphoryl diester phosphodiesterase